MPIYEFHCLSCDRDFEELMRNAREKAVCPQCGGKKCKKQMSRASYHRAGGSNGSASLPSGSSGCGSCSSSNCASCSR